MLGRSNLSWDVLCVGRGLGPVWVVQGLVQEALVADGSHKIKNNVVSPHFSNEKSVFEVFLSCKHLIWSGVPERTILSAFCMFTFVQNYCG